jgi:hypothetical protein
MSYCTDPDQEKCVISCFQRVSTLTHINMVFPIVAHPTPWDHDVNNSESTLYQKAFIWIWPILAQWFWRRFLNDPTQFLHFCNYLPFEEDMALYLNNLEFSLPKDDLCQVWSKLVQWFWRRSRKCKSLQTDGQTDNGRSDQVS